MNRIISKKGQTVLPEYVVGFFLVVAAMVTLTVFVQRALQARARDAKIYMVNLAAQGCAQAGAGCQQAAGTQEGQFNYEYEPYYSKAVLQVDRAQNESKSLEIGSIFRRNSGEATQVNTTSVQTAPENAH